MSQRRAISACWLNSYCDAQRQPGSQDQQLPIALRERVLGEHVRCEHQPAAQEGRVVGERPEDVQRRAVGSAQSSLVEELVHFVARICHWRDPGGVHGVILSQRSRMQS